MHMAYNSNNYVQDSLRDKDTSGHHTTFLMHSLNGEVSSPTGLLKASACQLRCLLCWVEALHPASAELVSNGNLLLSRTHQKAEQLKRFILMH